MRGKYASAESKASTKLLGPGRKNGAETAQDAMLCKQALDLRIQGLSYEAIAKTMGTCWSTSRNLVERGTRSVVREAATEVLAMELARLDQLHKAVWEEALRGDVALIDRVLKIMERRARYMGLDAAAGLRIEGDLSVANKSVPELLADIAEAVKAIEGGEDAPGTD